MSELIVQGGQEVIGVSRIEGPILVVENAGSIGYDEVVEVIDSSGVLRLGRVLEVGEGMAVVEVFAGTTGLSIDGTNVRFLGGPLKIPVAEEMLGRVFDGLGRPLDGGPQPLTDHYGDVNGEPINPTARVYPRDYHPDRHFRHRRLEHAAARPETAPLLRGRHPARPAGCPNRAPGHPGYAGRAKHAQKNEQFAVVFAAMGVKHDVADFFRNSFAESGALTRVAMFLNLADDPPVERLVTPRAALTLAEYLAFERNMHVLVVFTDMTNYGEALRQISNIRGEVPSRKGYPGYLYSDLASMYERTGRIKSSEGSITQIPILTMPNDDITHPMPDLTGYITEGQIVLGRDLSQEGIYPAHRRAAQPVALDERRHRQEPHAGRPPAPGRPALCSLRPRTGCARPGLRHRRRGAQRSRPGLCKIWPGLRARIHQPGCHRKPQHRTHPGNRLEAGLHAAAVKN